MGVSPDGILEATFDPAWAAVRLVVDGGMWPAPTVTNLLTYGTMNADLTGWEADNGAGGVASVAWTDQQTRFGGGAAEVTCGGTISGEGIQSSAGNAAAAAVSGNHVASAWIKAPAGTALGLYLEEEISPGSWLGTGSTFAADGSWQRVQVVRSVTAGRALRVSVSTTSTAAVVFWVDDVILETGGTATAWPLVDSITITKQPTGGELIPVRGVEDLQVIGGWFLGTDHEIDLGSTITYTAIGTADGVEVATATVTVDTTGAGAGLWVKVAGKPDLTVRCPIKDLGAVSSPTIGGVYQVAAGGGTVAQTSAQWSGVQSDRLTVSVSVSVADRARLRAALDASRVVLLQPVGSSDMDAGWYFVWTMQRSNIAQVEDFDQRLIELDVQRTGMPAGQGVGIAGVSWAALAESYATWADVLAAFDTWFDVLKDDPS